MSKKDKQVAPVFLGSTGNTGIMRGRDVREKLQNVADPRVVEIIAKIAEINHTNCKAIAELATMIDQVVNIAQGMTDIAANMKDRTDKLMQTQESLEGSKEYDVEPTEH